MIHPTAIVHPKAEIDSSVKVGAYAVIDAHVVVGPDCMIAPHVYITGLTRVGRGNKFYSGGVIGEAPQDLKYRGAASGLTIGDNNTFREHVTVHRANDEGDNTVIGSNNLLMASSHVAHNCVLGNSIIVANGALLGGHVTVYDRAVISGNCLVHQFVRVGTMAMMQGGSAISKDLPPFAIARGDNGICGLNTVGLRRAGFTSEQRLELRRVYHALFRERGLLADRVARARKQFTSDIAQTLIDFVAASKRGICADVSGSSGKAEDEEE
jgi:UDP-N-acetylglucosamine acyltransferase